MTKTLTKIALANNIGVQAVGTDAADAIAQFIDAIGVDGTAREAGWDAEGNSILVEYEVPADIADELDGNSDVEGFPKTGTRWIVDFPDYAA